MRQKMADAHATRGDLRELFDLKHDPGGLVDVEFIVQYLVLGHSHAHPELTGNKGNIALLKMAADAGLIPATGRDSAQRLPRLPPHAARPAPQRHQGARRTGGSRRVAPVVRESHRT
jgi:glutamate-ammonia-ligase adenylyltransferase